MTRIGQIEREKEAELKRFGWGRVCEGVQPVDERTNVELWQGASMTAVLTGNGVCQSLADTAKTGGC